MNNVYNPKGYVGPSYGAYITYSSPRESATAILAIDQFVLHERMLRASFGTTKYCSYFLNGQKCTNRDCLYLHELYDEDETYTKEEMSNKQIFAEQQKIALKLSRATELSYEEFSEYMAQFRPPRFKGVLPPAESIHPHASKRKFSTNAEKIPAKAPQNFPDPTQQLRSEAEYRKKRTPGHDKYDPNFDRAREQVHLLVVPTFPHPCRIQSRRLGSSRTPIV